MFAKKMFFAALAASMMTIAASASATVVNVDSNANSIQGGSSFDSGIHLTQGNRFTVSVDPSQTWNNSWGDDGWWFNADGMVGGWVMNLANPDGTTFAAPWASLVAQIGTGTPDAGNFFLVGTNFDGTANASGDLNFFYIDSDGYNNVGSVDADVHVPEPASLALLGAGLMGLGALRRKKK